MTDLATMTKEQLIALGPEGIRKAIAQLQAAANQPKRLTMKVSEKGALSLYGLGRFPVTLYRGQWERLALAMPDIKVFIEQNADLLAVKA